MTAEAVILEQIILNRIALLEARTEEICALLAEPVSRADTPGREPA